MSFADIHVLRPAFLLLALLVAVPAAAQQPTHPDLVFKSTPQRLLTLDLYIPEVASDPPLVIYIHGGGWSGGSPKNPPLRHLLDEGFAMAAISYRFSQEAKFPAQLEDVRDAVAWLVANARKFGYDASRIALIGGSAGGHLAMLAGCALASEALPVRAVISFFGPADFFFARRPSPPRRRSPAEVCMNCWEDPRRSIPERPARPARRCGWTNIRRLCCFFTVPVTRWSMWTSRSEWPPLIAPPDAPSNSSSKMGPATKSRISRTRSTGRSCWTFSRPASGRKSTRCFRSDVFPDHAVP